MPKLACDCYKFLWSLGVIGEAGTPPTSIYIAGDVSFKLVEKSPKGLSPRVRNVDPIFLDATVID